MEKDILTGGDAEVGCSPSADEHFKNKYIPGALNFISPQKKANLPLDLIVSIQNQIEFL